MERQYQTYPAAIDEEDWADLKVLTPEGVDLSLLIKKFQEYGQYQYILYP